MKKFGIPGVAEIEFAQEDKKAETGASSTHAAPCEISGRVFDDDTSMAFPGVQVGSLPDQFPAAQNFKALATSGPDGAFSFACPPPREDNSSYTFALARDAWRGCLFRSDLELPQESQSGINLYVSAKEMEDIAREEGGQGGEC